MTFYNFETTTHGKWILAGEHAVLRGNPALVFPVAEKQLTLKYTSSTSDLNAAYSGDTGADLHLLFWSVLEHGMQLLGKSLNSLYGHFDLSSNIPIGVGMGASAALSVATARWFEAQGFIPFDEIQAFATQLENLFHGKSSGLDIAGVSATGGIRFQKGELTQLPQSWKPQWYLSSCGQIGITSHCIHQVQTLWSKDKNLGLHIDNLMAESVQLATQALVEPSKQGIELLVQAFNLAESCFRQWGLISENLQQHLTYLMQSGAIAVKPTGSGGGGFVVSLWETPPPKELDLILI